jgi:hypothetical protein
MRARDLPAVLTLPMPRRSQRAAVLLPLGRPVFVAGRAAGKLPTLGAFQPATGIPGDPSFASCSLAKPSTRRNMPLGIVTRKIPLRGPHWF